MTGKLKKTIIPILIFLIGAAVGIGIMQLRWVRFWENEDRSATEHREKILGRIDNGYYSLPNGDFYLNGDNRNAYYKIKDGTIQLYANDDQLLDYYYAHCAGMERRSGTLPSSTDFINSPYYEQTIERMKAYISGPADYIFDFSTSGSGVEICAEVLGEDVHQYIYDKETDGGVYLGGKYINENVFEFDDCVWIRL